MLKAEPMEAAREIGFLVAVGVDRGCGEDAIDEWGWGSGAGK